MDSKFLSDSKATEAAVIAELDCTEVQLLVKKRSYKRQSLTKTINAIATLPVPISKEEKNFYTNKLTELKDQLIKLDDDIEEKLIIKCEAENKIEELLEISDRYLDSLNRSLLKLSEDDYDNEQRSVPVMSNGNLEVPLPKLKLPNVKLPEFDGRPDSYNKFMEILENVLSKYNLSQFEKFSYLKQQVYGSARKIVDSVPDSDSCYDVAKGLLKEAFSDKTTQQFAVIENILNLKLNSLSESYSWISNVRVLVQQLENLQITSDTFSQYFLWRGLSPHFKQQYIAVTGKSKPCLEDLVKNAFPVFDRIKESSGSPISEIGTVARGEVTAMATKVDHSARNTEKAQSRSTCALCHSCRWPSNHRISCCPKFNSPILKINKIKEMNGCLKCGLLNHTIKDCKFKFSGKCFKCSKFHASFLCNVEPRQSFQKTGSSVQKPTIPKTDKLNDTVNTNLVNFNVMSTYNDNNILIPTFTMRLADRRVAGFCDARVMYDPASQVTFITERVLKNISYEVVQTICRVNITGFNGSKLINTKVIRVTTSLNNQFRSFEAIVVPEINTTLKYPNLSQICEKFSECNIELADKHLGDDGTVDVLLGVNYAHILPIQSCSFGIDESSLFYHTCTGIMLAGRISVILRNLEHLSLLKNFIEKFKKAF